MWLRFAIEDDSLLSLCFISMNFLLVNQNCYLCIGAQGLGAGACASDILGIGQSSNVKLGSLR